MGGLYVAVREHIRFLAWMRDHNKTNDGCKMETGKPKVGEVVEIADCSILHGKKYLVVACPVGKQDMYDYRDNIWWVVPADGSRDHEEAGHIPVGTEYVVVSQTGAVPDETDAKLTKRRDDNLRDYFFS